MEHFTNKVFLLISKHTEANSGCDMQYQNQNTFLERQFGFWNGTEGNLVSKPQMLHVLYKKQSKTKTSLQTRLHGGWEKGRHRRTIQKDYGINTKKAN